MSDSPFREWAIVELFGHTKLAGEVSEVTVGGAGFLRIDVPAIPPLDSFTKLLGPASIYAITIVSEEVARTVVSHLKPRPIKSFDLPQLPLLSSVKSRDFDDEDDGVPF